MLNTISNFSRQSERYGDIHFISFLGAILSRLAYLNDNKFLTSYNSIMGSVIHPQILQAINGVDSNNLPLLLDDQTLFGLNKGPNDIFKNFEYQFKGKNYIDFIKLKMSQNVNIINGDLDGNISYPVPGQQTPLNAVKYISIGWSNYGEIYVVADKRMPNTLFLLFRGTYSAKTAALYSKPTSIIPLTVCNDAAGKPEQFLYGIFKTTSEMIHTTIEAMRYLATDFLGASQPNSVKIFTTGHSLGGAMCTDFTYLLMDFKKTAPYNTAPYNILADNIICVSLGAPRCMGSSVAEKFCKAISQKKILFLRITTNGDPVPALPPKTGFQHPCSENDKMRQQISEACAPQLTMRPTPNINYDGNLDCLNYKGRAYVPNILSHTVYLDILYTKAVDIVNFLKGIGIQKEVLRGPDGSTICRLIMGQNGNYKAIFFDVNKAREIPNNLDNTIDTQLKKPETEQVGGGFFGSLFSSKPTPVQAQAVAPVQAQAVAPVQAQVVAPVQAQVVAPVQAQVVEAAPVQAQGVEAVQAQGVEAVPVAKAVAVEATQEKSKIPSFKIGGPVAEDRRMTLEAFNTLIQQMVPIKGDLCPLSGKMFNPFNNQIMPNLSCPGLIGGRRINKYKKLKTKKHKSKKRRQNKSRRR
jgi:hypothetical protein